MHDNFIACSIMIFLLSLHDPLKIIYVINKKNDHQGTVWRDFLLSTFQYYIHAFLLAATEYIKMNIIHH